MTVLVCLLLLAVATALSLGTACAVAVRGMTAPDPSAWARLRRGSA